jgi:hypothetical protein
MKNKIEKFLDRLVGISCLILIIVSFSCSNSNSDRMINSISDIKEYRALRNEKLNTYRPVIHNNDGCDTYLYPADRNFSIGDFLDFRSAGLKGSDVSTISYCTISSSFGQFTHNTKVGEFLTITHNRPGKRNIVPDFVKLGTDPLEVTSRFARENGFEFFWSNRINDTHDYGHRSDNPYERWSKLKTEHPEFLFGYSGEKLPYGRWSAIDFSHKEIRDLCVEYYAEVCENYDVDGIELDFFRHLYLFKNVARGGVATAAQRDMLTDMVSQIREMTERVGMKKGKPILVLIRVPDSIEYCQGVGIDLKEWMTRELVDIIVGSGYFRLNSWNYLVNEGHKYNIKVFAGLSEPRIKNEHPFLVRLQNPVYRARSAAAWQAGIDGIYIFNEYNTRSKYLSEIGNAVKIKDKNNLYFVTYRNSNPNSYLENGRNYSSIPILTPSNPINLNTKPLTFPLEIGDESIPAKVFLILYSNGDKPEKIVATLNGTPLKYLKSTKDGLSFFEIPQEEVKAGENILVLKYGSEQNSLTLLDAAILFYRTPDDVDTKELAFLCFDN